jgi:hypothetical protein
MDVHRAMEHEIKRRYDPTHNVVRAEFPLLEGEPASRVQAGSSRLDILHRVEGSDTICVYDIKTGQAQLNPAQAARIYKEAFEYGLKEGIANPRILVIELHRTP